MMKIVVGNALQVTKMREAPGAAHRSVKGCR